MASDRLNPTLHITEFRRPTPASDLLVAEVLMRQDDHLLHSYPLYIPPLEYTYTHAECQRRAVAYAEHAVAIVQQMYMSTTRGLPAGH